MCICMRYARKGRGVVEAEGAHPQGKWISFLDFFFLTFFFQFSHIHVMSVQLDRRASLLVVACFISYAILSQFITTSSSDVQESSLYLLSSHHKEVIYHADLLIIMFLYIFHSVHMLSVILINVPLSWIPVKASVKSTWHSTIALKYGDLSQWRYWWVALCLFICYNHDLLLAYTCAWAQLYYDFDCSQVIIVCC